MVIGGYRMSNKSANLYVRIEPEVKEKAEKILSEIGLSASSAVNMFYKQIILRRGLPFEATVPERRFPSMEGMSQKEIDAEIARGFQSIQEGRCKPASEAFDELWREYGL